MPRHKKNRSADHKAPPPAASRFWSLDTVVLALILLTTVLVYLPSMRGGFLWDDDANVTRLELQPPAGLVRIWFELGATQQYYPLLHTAFWFEHQLWGDAPIGYHIISLFWHLCSVVLVYAIFKRLKIAGGLLAASIFALHPVMVESVAWITEQKNTLSTVFYLSSLLMYLRFDELRKRSMYLAALGLFVLALFSKTAIVTLPAALLVIFWWQRGTLSWRRDVLPLVPFFVAAGLIGLTTCWVEWKHVGAVGTDFKLTLLQRFLLAGRAVWFYLGKLFWPGNLIFMYPRWNIDPSQWWQWTYPVAALMTTALLWALRSRSRAPFAAWLFFCGTLLPMLGLLNQYLFLYTFVSDHFLYVASLGIIALVSGTTAKRFAAWPHTLQVVVGGCCILYLAMLALLTSRQVHMYSDPITLYETTLDRNPSSWMVHNNLGLELASQGKMDEAVAHYRSSLDLNPKSINALNNLGRALTDMGQLPEAIAVFRDALVIEPDDPIILNSLGAALIHSNQFAKAREHLERALTLKPDYAEGHINMALVYGLTGQLPQAIDHFQKAAELNPKDANAHNNWGLFLARSGNHGDAATHYRQALALAPDRADIQSNYADALRMTGRPAEAIEWYKSALQRNPGYMQAYAGLAQALASTGHPQEAIAMAKRSIELANSTGQTAAAEFMTNWLNQFQSQLPR